MTPAITPELRERAGKDRPISRRGFLLGTSAVAVAAALPVVPATAEAVAAPVAVRGPMTLPLLKELSERALPFLEKHFTHGLREGAFLAEEGGNYHGLNIACDCSFNRTEQLGGCGCQWHPLAGTPMVGGMSGYYEPEWDEQTAYEALNSIVPWHDKPDDMPDAEWVEALAIVGMTLESHAARLAQWEIDCAIWDDCAVFASSDTPPPASPLATGEAA